MGLGTRLYSSPEKLFEASCEKYCDLWNLGVLAYQLANLAPPFELNQQLNKNTFECVARKYEVKRPWRN